MAHIVEFSKAFTNHYMEERGRILSKRSLDKIYFPEHFPAFRNLVSDDNGRLYVFTFEKTKASGEWLIDIFNSDGVFTGKMTLGDGGEENPPFFKIGDSCLYVRREKESGFKELVVYKMNWE